MLNNVQYIKIKKYLHRVTLTQLVYRKLEEVKLISKEQRNSLLKEYPELAKLYELIKEFHRIIFSKKANNLDNWINQVSGFTTIPDLKSFAEGIIQDKEAVKNAILYDYNNGLAEGTIVTFSFNDIINFYISFPKTSHR